MSRQQLIALGILGMAVIAVYTLGIVMAADVLKTVRAESAELPGGPLPEQLLTSSYPATWTPTLTPTPRSTNTPLPTWTPGPTRTSTFTPAARATYTLQPTATNTPSVAEPPAPPPTTALPTRTPSPTPGRLVFEADDDALVAGECATLLWIADGAQSVHLNDEEVDWQGSEEVCPKKTKTYTLKVEHKDGGETKLKVEIEVFPPTPTITKTPTKTPTNTLTPTSTFTSTPTPTDTLIPTDTPTSTPTHTATPTDTPTEIP